MAGFTFKGILWRFLFALAMVCFTWNPTRYNYFAWARAQWEAQAPLVAFSGLVILVGWIVFLRATARSLGVVGIILGLALAGTVLWTLFFYDLLNRENTELISWIVLALLAVILAMGMSWSHLRRRWAGQHDVDDIDE
jgi:uncharacterized membrane protein